MDLASMKRWDLQALCKRHGLAGGGTNADLVARLAAALTGSGGAEEQAVEVVAGKGCLKRPAGGSSSGGSGEGKKVTFVFEEEDEPEVEVEARIRGRRGKPQVMRSPVVAKTKGIQKAGETLPGADLGGVERRRTRAQAAGDSADESDAGEAATDAPVRRSRRNVVNLNAGYEVEMVAGVVTRRAVEEEDKVEEAVDRKRKLVAKTKGIRKAGETLPGADLGRVERRRTHAQAAGDSADESDAVEAGTDAPVRRSRRNVVNLNAVNEVEMVAGVVTRNNSAKAVEEKEKVGEAVDRKRKRKTREHDEGADVSGQVGVSRRSTRSNGLLSGLASVSSAVEKKRGGRKAGDVTDQTCAEEQTSEVQHLGRTLRSGLVVVGPVSPIVSESKSSRRKLQEEEPAVKVAKLEISGRTTRSTLVAAAVTFPIVVEKKRRKTEDLHSDRVPPTVPELPIITASVTRVLRSRAVQVKDSAVEETHFDNKLESKRQPSRPSTRNHRHQHVASSVEEGSQEQVAPPCEAPPLRRLRRNHSEGSKLLNNNTTSESNKRSRAPMEGNDLKIARSFTLNAAKDGKEDGVAKADGPLECKKRNPQNGSTKVARNGGEIPFSDSSGKAKAVETQVVVVEPARKSRRDSAVPTLLEQGAKGKRRNIRGQELQNVKDGDVEDLRTVKEPVRRSTWKSLVPAMLEKESKDLTTEIIPEAHVRRSTRKSIAPAMLEKEKKGIPADMSPDAHVIVRRSMQKSVIPGMLNNENNDYGKMRSADIGGMEKQLGAEEPVRRLTCKSAVPAVFEKGNKGLHKEMKSEVPVKRSVHNSVAPNAVDKMNNDRSEIVTTEELGVRTRNSQTRLQFAVQNDECQQRTTHKSSKLVISQVQSKPAATKGRPAKRTKTTVLHMPLEEPNADGMVVREATQDGEKVTQEYSEVSIGHIQEIRQVSATVEEFPSAPLLGTLLEDTDRIQSVNEEIHESESGLVKSSHEEQVASGQLVFLEAANCLEKTNSDEVACKDEENKKPANCINSSCEQSDANGPAGEHPYCVSDASLSSSLIASANDNDELHHGSDLSQLELTDILDEPIGCSNTEAPQQGLKEQCEVLHMPVEEPNGDGTVIREAMQDGDEVTHEQGLKEQCEVLHMPVEEPNADGTIIREAMQDGDEVTHELGLREQCEVMHMPVEETNADGTVISEAMQDGDEVTHEQGLKEQCEDLHMLVEEPNADGTVIRESMQDGEVTHELGLNEQCEVMHMPVEEPNADVTIIREEMQDGDEVTHEYIEVSGSCTLEIRQVNVIEEESPSAPLLGTLLEDPQKLQIMNEEIHESEPGLTKSTHEDDQVASDQLVFLEAANCIENTNSEEVACKDEENKKPVDYINSSCEPTDANGPAKHAYCISDSLLSCSLVAPDNDNDELHHSLDLSWLESTDFLDELIGCSSTEVPQQDIKELCEVQKEDQVAYGAHSDLIEVATVKNLESGVLPFPAKEKSNLQDARPNSELEGAEVVESGLSCDKGISNILEFGSSVNRVVEKVPSDSSLPEDSSMDHYQRHKLLNDLSVEESRQESPMHLEDSDLVAGGTTEKPPFHLAIPNYNVDALSKEFVHSTKNDAERCSLESQVLIHYAIFSAEKSFSMASGISEAAPIEGSESAKALLSDVETSAFPDEQPNAELEDDEFKENSLSCGEDSVDIFGAGSVNNEITDLAEGCLVDSCQEQEKSPNDLSARKSREESAICQFECVVRSAICQTIEGRFTDETSTKYHKEEHSGYNEDQVTTGILANSTSEPSLFGGSESVMLPTAETSPLPDEKFNTMLEVNEEHSPICDEDNNYISDTGPVGNNLSTLKDDSCHDMPAPKSPEESAIRLLPTAETSPLPDEKFNTTLQVNEEHSPICDEDNDYMSDTGPVENNNLSTLKDNSCHDMPAPKSPEESAIRLVDSILASEGIGQTSGRRRVDEIRTKLLSFKISSAVKGSYIAMDAPCFAKQEDNLSQSAIAFLGNSMDTPAAETDPPKLNTDHSVAKDSSTRVLLGISGRPTYVELAVDNPDNILALEQVHQDDVQVQEGILEKTSLGSATPECKHECGLLEEAVLHSMGNDRCSSSVEQSPFGLQSLFSQENIEEPMGYGANDVGLAAENPGNKLAMELLQQDDVQVQEGSAKPDCKHESRLPEEIELHSMKNERCSSRVEQSPLGLQFLFSQESMEEPVEYEAPGLARVQGENGVGGSKDEYRVENTPSPEPVEYEAPALARVQDENEVGGSKDEYRVEKTLTPEPVSDHETQVDLSVVSKDGDCVYTCQQDNEKEGLTEPSHEQEQVASGQLEFLDAVNHMKKDANSEKVSAIGDDLLDRSLDGPTMDKDQILPSHSLYELESFDFMDEHIEYLKEQSDEDKED